MTGVLLVDGVDIDAGLRGIRFEGFGNLFTTSELVGDNYETPGRDGEVWRRKSRAAGTNSLRFAIVTKDRGAAGKAAVNAEWLKVLRLFPRRRPVELTRFIDVVTEHGIETITQVAQAEMTGSIQPEWISHYAQVGVLSFKVLEGAWFSQHSRVVNIDSIGSTFVPVSGSTDTHKLELSFTGYTNAGIQRLTNLSTGVYLEIDYAKSAVASSSPFVVLVDEFRAIRESGGINYQQLRAITHVGDPRFMILDPDAGDNELVLTGGKCRLEWKAAWL
jgi:hypothetical protein